MEVQKNLGDEVIKALVEVEDLDQLQVIYSSNKIADGSPAIQRVMHDVVQAERRRRSRSDVDRYALPRFADWHPVNLLQSGVLLIAGCEAASIAGDPAVQNFSFRLLQFYFAGLAKAHLENFPCTND